ncbi:YvrJ family protein [Desulforamulus aquiferis]|uniref:YvrJ family protein n=1 Tax=Desulforamulus aquiferis TaxID=1397668 RepID=A0AAW7ZFS5_9FIRM|nr:YvrJ family protein [Desulforamulus aquiferis]MDO7788201.1 YvrJ family protein [Desulforamulus aquiferis]
MEDLLKLASNYGFPMVVAGYLLLRLEPTIRDLQKSINLLSLIIAKQSNIDLEEVGELINTYCGGPSK